MRSQFHKVNLQVSNNDGRKNGVVIINFNGGGHGCRGNFRAIRRKNEINVFCDVASELTKHELDFMRIPDSYVLPLSERESILSLIQLEHGDCHKVIEQIGNALADDGMGGCSGVGGIAGKELLKTRRFNDFLEDLGSKAIRKSGGNIKHFEIRGFGSGAGGTNALLELIVITAMVIHLKELGATIAVKLYMTDSVAFAGLGRNIHANQASALVEVERLIRSSKIGDCNRVIWDLRLIGAPPVGDDDLLRQEHMLIDIQAWFCAEMKPILQIKGPNIALSSAFGNISHTSTDYFRSIPRPQIAKTVAFEYHAAIEEAIGNIRPLPSMIRSINSNHSITPSTRNSISEIIDGCDSMTVEDMIRATMQDEGRHSYDFAAVNSEDETYDCELVGEHFTTPPKSLSEAIHNLTTLATIQYVLHRENINVTQKLVGIQSKVRKLSHKAYRVYGRAQSATRFVKTAQSRAVRIGNELRRFSDQLLANSSMQAELSKSIRAIKAEYENQLSRLTQVSDTLEHERKKGRNTDRNDLYYFNSVDVAFEDLLTLPALDHQRRQLVLAAQATMVSVEGIRYILGAHTNTIEDLAIAAIGTAHRTGAWPGAVQRLSAKVVIVLPPTNKNLNASLKTAIINLAPGVTVVTSDSCDMGLNVVRFHLFTPEHEDDLLPGYLKSEYQRAMQGPTRVLHQMPSM